VDLELNGQTVLVTGAGQGIGEEIGVWFAREGANVAFHYNRSRDGAEAAAKNVATEYGVRSVALGADLSDHESIEALPAEIRNHFDSPLAVLVNNAAYTGSPEKFVDSDTADWQRQISVTLDGMMYLTKTLLPDLAASGKGSIINIAGESGRVGESLATVTSATRAAAIGFTKALAKEVARDRIRVNAVTLGLTDTATTRRTVFDQAKPELIERIRRAYPLRRFGEPADIAPLVVFLGSPLTSWITGQTYGVNGGYAMI
jgi:2-hydroxycyclohexanecarboxyl-CoA dehydrogenase